MKFYYSIGRKPKLVRVFAAGKGLALVERMKMRPSAAA